MQKRTFIKTLGVAALAGCILAAVAPRAQAAYPDKQITVVVPFPPGGLTDLVGRRFAAYLEKQTGQTVVVQNKAGASGQVGAQQVSRAAPDGYTLLVTATHFGISAAIRRDLPYDPVRDFSPVALFLTTPNILVVNSKVPVKNLQEYLQYANNESGGMSFGSSGAGGSTHLSGELLKLKTKANMQHIPYKGMVLQVNDLVGGQLESGFVDPSSVMQFIEAGQLRPIGVTGKERFDILPDVPTIAEQGVPGYEATTWIAVVAPANTPADIQQYLNKMAIDSMQTPDSREFLKQISATRSTLTPAEMSDYLRSEIAKWTEVAKAANLQTGTPK
ncbi:Bug family tripartite tricarboxylate transporter substrate binding protein [Bordetella petrii]|uniref:Bug family tripartite tricarboxylate transporter substrate binding protein n=1 Tax=Bordetella petrii TaxID=94624 RepID=UPI001E36A14D|nr:tripartite tricarboxylate transporter substrate binding protein [Bordetella petrii]MCD0501685.1 tripartite tricarboxylate transporter substrate binding protein [Bordetella petrii]